jgi:hypothetical protein
MTPTSRWLGLAVLAACKADSRESDDFYMDDDVPAGNCMTGTGCATEGSDGDSTAASEATCESTLQCDVGQMCVATFDGDIGEFACSSTCIDDFDEERWCIDDDGCCGADSICQGRGYCVPAASADSSTTAGG